jgi:predicted nuclease with TOPRIM domain
MVEIEKLQEKMGEALGLEIAAQKAVEELGSKGLLDESGMLTQLKKMQSQAGNHQSRLEKTIQNLADGIEQLDPTKVQQVAQETAQKCSSMMQTYLGLDPDSSEAIEFLCLAEGGEVTHYEVLAAMSKKLNGNMKNAKKLSTAINSILREEKRHLALCTKLAKQIATSY